MGRLALPEQEEINPRLMAGFGLCGENPGQGLEKPVKMWYKNLTPENRGGRGMYVELTKEKPAGMHITTLTFCDHGGSEFEGGSSSPFGKLVAKILSECSNADAPYYMGYRLNPSEVSIPQGCQTVVELLCMDRELLDQVTAFLIGAAEYVLVGPQKAMQRYIELAEPLVSTFDAGNADRDILEEMDALGAALRRIFPSKAASALGAYVTSTSEEFKDVVVSSSLGYLWYYQMIKRGETTITLNQ